MTMRLKRVLYALFSLVILTDAKSCEGSKIDDFFHSIDIDGDGEIEHFEAEKFYERMNAPADESSVPPPSAAAEESLDRAILSSDFSYGGNTISAAELLEHLQGMLNGEKVVSWVSHGLRLPQYATKFRSHSIDGLDFPALVEGGVEALESELGIKSLLHQRKIHLAMMRQLLGLGAPPGPPLNPQCLPTSCGSIQLSWGSPGVQGLPPLHKYLVQRRPMGSKASPWVDVGDPDQEGLVDGTSLIPKLNYSYRIQSWGGHGPSEWVYLEGCKTESIFIAECSPEGSEFVSPPEIPSKNSSSSFWRYISGTSFVGFCVLLRQVPVIKLVNGALGALHTTFIVKLRITEFVVFCFLWMRSGIDSLLCILHRASKGESGGQHGENCEESVNNDKGKGREKGKKKGNGLVVPFPFPSEQGTESEALMMTLAEYSLKEMLTAVSQSVSSSSPSESKSGSHSGGRELRPCKSESSLSSSSDALNTGGTGSTGGTPLASLDARLLRKNSGTSGISGISGTSGGSMGSEREGGKGQSRRKGKGSSRSGSESEAEEDIASGFRDLSSSPVGGGVPKGRRKCNWEGCPERFDGWNFMANLSKHFCRDCQGVYCGKHTRISSHAITAQCGLDSQCLCITCFARLAPEAQQLAEKGNKLKQNQRIKGAEGGSGPGAVSASKSGFRGKILSAPLFGKVNSGDFEGSSFQQVSPQSSQEDLRKALKESSGEERSFGGSEGEDSVSRKGKKKGPVLGWLGSKGNNGNKKTLETISTQVKKDEKVETVTSWNGNPKVLESSSKASSDSELRWRICHLYALKNRGSTLENGTEVLGEKGRSPQKEGREQWGKSKPPRHPPSQARTRWLDAGIWALGKELERRKSTSWEEGKQQ